MRLTRIAPTAASLVMVPTVTLPAHAQTAGAPAAQAPTPTALKPAAPPLVRRLAIG